MSNLRLYLKIKKSEDPEELRKIAKKLYREREKLEDEINYKQAHTENGYELAKKWKAEAELHKSNIDRVSDEAIRSGERLMARSRAEGMEEAAKIAEGFFEDDVIEATQIAKAIREGIDGKTAVNDDSFKIKTLEDVLRRVNARMGRK